MLVEDGEVVSLGQPLIADKRFDGVVLTAPAGGRVQAINRGPRRVLESVVIAMGEKADTIAFGEHDGKKMDRPRRVDAIKETLLKSGLWPCLPHPPLLENSRSEVNPGRDLRDGHRHAPAGRRPLQLSSSRCG